MKKKNHNITVPVRCTLGASLEGCWEKRVKNVCINVPPNELSLVLNFDSMDIEVDNEYVFIPFHILQDTVRKSLPQRQYHKATKAFKRNCASLDSMLEFMRDHSDHGYVLVATDIEIAEPGSDMWQNIKRNLLSKEHAKCIHALKFNTARLSSIAEELANMKDNK